MSEDHGHDARTATTWHHGLIARWWAKFNVALRNDVISGPDGKQVLVKDPSGNLVELFQPARPGDP